MRALALLALLAAIPAEAAEPLELGKWLARPGVRLVAVELYATWCKPCMAGVSFPIGVELQTPTGGTRAQDLEKDP